MNLVRFTPQRGATRISAQQLDFNFTRLTPINPGGNNAKYKVVQTPNGWFLDIRSADDLPARPQSGTFVLGCVNGFLEWIATESCDT